MRRTLRQGEEEREQQRGLYSETLVLPAKALLAKCRLLSPLSCWSPLRAALLEVLVWSWLWPQQRRCSEKVRADEQPASLMSHINTWLP